MLDHLAEDPPAEDAAVEQRVDVLGRAPSDAPPEG